MAETGAEEGGWGRVGRFALGVQLMAVLAWLWPIGLGGAMPVGGDVTQFSIGLMAFLKDALHAGRLPLWNDLWGFGFPGVGESQMGVFYPPHWLLYGILPLETAYTASLVLHTLWGSLGAYWAARRFGASREGAAVSGFSWSTCGFFLIHLSHQWSYTTGAWLPWAWGLTWWILRGKGRGTVGFDDSIGLSGSKIRNPSPLVGEGQGGGDEISSDGANPHDASVHSPPTPPSPTRGEGDGGTSRSDVVGSTIWGRGLAPYWLALVLMLQLLPGHFQLAFVTQLGIVVLTLEQGIERFLQRRQPFRKVRPVLAGFLGAFALAAMQLWPTFRLARLAAPRRDFEYLSGFAATPLHLITFVAPGFLERSPLWRPLVWDPFHTSPEEYLGYVGLVPLFLAGLTLLRSRKQAETRALATVGVVTLLLALGPYIPGFAWWCTLPGFSFFRAPARWMLGASLVLAILAGLGFDRLSELPRPGRWLRSFAAGGLVLVGLGVGLVELGLAPSSPASGLYRQGFDALPWHERDVYDQVVQSASRPNLDARVNETWARQGVALKSAPRPVFVEQRFVIYQQELGPTVALLLALGGTSLLAGRPNRLRLALVLLTGVDLLLLSRDRRVDVAPIRSLVEQSPVLQKLEQLGRGTRSIDTVRNLPIVARANPISAYRTLDLPTLDPLASFASRVPRNEEEVGLIARAQELTGASVRVYEPAEVLDAARARAAFAGEESGASVTDPALASWRYGQDLVSQAGPRLTGFRVSQLQNGGTQAWLVPLNPETRRAILENWNGNPGVVLEAMKDAKPVAVKRLRPEHLRLSVDAPGPSLLILSQLADPQWQGTIHRDGTTALDAVSFSRAFGIPGQGAWQAIELPASGRWSFALEYRGQDVWVGLGISAAAAVVWISGLVWELQRNRSGVGVAKVSVTT
ncbi:MAG: hypothetical protein U0794_11335 [Isosphaeraceae bacterium]